jgi:hypothetical protein
MRRVPKVEGQPGRDVTGAELPVRPVKEAVIRCGKGAAWSKEDPNVIVAAVDGLPVWDGNSNIDVKHELELDAVGTGSGDINFVGSVVINGSVGEGRVVKARHSVTVHGNVERARIESGGDLRVDGSAMSSILRAGGDRAIAAAMLDLFEDAPGLLGDFALRASQLREAAASRGQDLSHGLSIQLVLEQFGRDLLARLKAGAEQLREAGPDYWTLAREIREWHRALATAAISNLGTDGYLHVLNGISAYVEEARKAVATRSDVSVNYMQRCEVEATGRLTLDGKGAFSSQIVAWGGITGSIGGAVIRGGSIVSHGDVTAKELGSPSGAMMRVQLGHGLRVKADLVYSGTLILSPSTSHQFVADRSHVDITVAGGGQMDVGSLAA